MIEKGKEFVFTTKDYDAFKFMAGNREACINLRKDLVNSIQKYGILQPVIVNEKYEILDGQHRFLVAKKLGIEVSFTIKQGLDLGAVQELNGTQKEWTLQECVDSGVKLGMPDYIVLDEMSKRSHLAPSFVAALLSGRTMNSSTIRASVKSFKFEITDPEFAEAQVTKLMEIRDAAKKMNTAMARVLCTHIFSSQFYDHKRMLEQIEKKWEEEFIRTVPTPKYSNEWGNLFQKVYNLMKRDRSPIFFRG